MPPKNIPPKRQKKVIQKKPDILKEGIRQYNENRDKLIKNIKKYIDNIPNIKNIPNWELRDRILPTVRYENAIKTAKNNGNYVGSLYVKSATELKMQLKELHLDKNNVLVIEYRNNYGYKPLIARLIKRKPNEDRIKITNALFDEITNAINYIRPMYFEEGEKLDPEFIRVSAFRDYNTAPRKLKENMSTNCFIASLKEQVTLKYNYNFEEVGEDEIKQIASNEKLRIIIYDINGDVWMDYKPNKGKYTKVLVTAHNWHATTYDKSSTFVKMPDNYEVVENLDTIFKKLGGHPICDSKFNLLAVITEDKMYKLFHDPEYPTALTQGSANKRRFIDTNKLTSFTAYQDILDQGVQNAGIFVKNRKPIHSDIKIDQNKSFLSAALQIKNYPIGPFEHYLTNDYYFIENFEGMAYVEVNHGPDYMRVFNQGSGMYWFPTIRYAKSINEKFEIKYVIFSRNNKPLVFPTEKSVFNPLIGSLRANPKTVTIATRDENEALHLLHENEGKVLAFKTNMDFDEKLKYILDEQYQEYIDKQANDQSTELYDEIIEKVNKYEPKVPFFWVQIQSDFKGKRFPAISGYIYAQQQINMHKIISQFSRDQIVQIWVDGIIISNDAEPLVNMSDKVGDWKFEKIKNMAFTEPLYATHTYFIPEAKKLDIETDLFPVAFNTKHVFINAPGGFGKSHLINKLKSLLDSNIVTATTNLATLPLDGITIHKLLGYTFNGYNETKIHYPYPIVIVDEISMMSPDIYEKLQEFYPSSHYIFSGDFAQLPPVKSSFIDISDFYVHELKIDYRHKDDIGLAKYLEFLRECILKNKNPSFDFINDNVKIGAYTDQELVLANKNETVSRYNNIVATKGTLPVNSHKCVGLIPKDTMVIAMKNYKFKNVNIVKGMVFKYLGKWTTYQYEVDKETVVSKTPLEVQPYKAITIHQSQGQTFDKPYYIEIDFDTKKNLRLVYVALSRATRLDLITLSSPL